VRRLPWPTVEFVFDGVAYKFGTGFGAQLTSLEWRRPPAGTRRRLALWYGPYYDITIFQTYRQGMRIRCDWTIHLTGSTDEQLAQVRDLRKFLQDIV